MYTLAGGQDMNVGIRDLRRNLSRLLDRVAEGDEIVVLRHGKKLARIVPPKKEASRLPSQKELRRSIHVSGEALSRQIVEEREGSRY